MENKASLTANGHEYRLECQNCSWGVPIEEPQRQLSRVPIADGGSLMPPTERTDSEARELLDELHYDASVAELCEHLATGESDLNGDLIRRALAMADGKLCLVFDYQDKLEYIGLSDDWDSFASVTVKQVGDCWGPVEFEPKDVEHRLNGPIEVCHLENAPDQLRGAL
ncbi:hypothetical protein [Natronosalvus amylolyticus]|uniref:hypothetical protein n=1 Tax=Natronosalvus amylolyticus TaxID=2961994 RepID=UPI0020CA1FE2|nr:hypothetical protein [Natronosalvus amylolyticus]